MHTYIHIQVVQETSPTMYSYLVYYLYVLCTTYLVRTMYLYIVHLHTLYIVAVIPAFGLVIKALSTT